MDLNRFFVGWLLVAGLVGVYAQSDDEDSSEKLTTWIAPRSKYRTLDESASAPNPTNEDSSAATDVFGFVNEAGSCENSDPGGSTSWMSQEDYDWHFKKGEEVLRRLSDETNKKRANEDSSAATDVFGFVKEAGSRENSNPGGSTSWMSQEDYDWHFKKGEEVLRTLSDEINKKRANGGWLDPQMQSHNRIPGKSMWDDWYPISIRDRIQAELAAFEKAVFDKREGQSITKERVPGKELNKPGPSRLEKSKEKANRERLDRQMQAHGKKILDQRISVQEPFVDFSKNRMQTEQGFAESAPAINAKSASPYKIMESRRWKPEEKNIILKEFKEYIDAKKVPPWREIQTARDKHQLLRSRTVGSMRQWIIRHIEDKASRCERMERLDWKPEEKNIILKEFKEHIDAKKVPPCREIQTVRDKHQLLSRRNVGSIRRWISRHIKEKASRYERMDRLGWKPEDKNIILKEFKEYIDAKLVPLCREIETVRDKHQLLSRRTVGSIRMWISRHIEEKASPDKRISRLSWKPEESNIILKEFEEYIDAKKVPPRREIKIMKDKHQLLRSRAVDSIKTWISRHIKKTHN